jgi:GxxExxY protein
VEQIYENSLVVELHKRGHDVQKQINCDVRYQGELVGQHRLDLLVDSTVVVELKSVDALADIHTAQLRSTLKAAGKRISLLMNFNQKTLTDGPRRVIH